MISLLTGFDIFHKRGKKYLPVNAITGAITYVIYVITYAQKRNRPIAFYTNPPYADANYHCMVERLSQIAEKWGFWSLISGIMKRLTVFPKNKEPEEPPDNAGTPGSVFLYIAYAHF